MFWCFLECLCLFGFFDGKEVRFVFVGVGTVKGRIEGESKMELVVVIVVVFTLGNLVGVAPVIVLSGAKEGGMLGNLVGVASVVIVGIKEGDDTLDESEQTLALGDSWNP